MHAQRVGEDRLDHVAVADRDPDRAGAVLGLDRGVAAADGGDRAGLHGRASTRRRGTSPPTGGAGRPSRAAPWPGPSAAGPASRRSRTRSGRARCATVDAGGAWRAAIAAAVSWQRSSGLVTTRPAARGEPVRRPRSACVGAARRAARPGAGRPARRVAFAVVRPWRTRITVAMPASRNGASLGGVIVDSALYRKGARVPVDCDRTDLPRAPRRRRRATATSSGSGCTSRPRPSSRTSPTRSACTSSPSRTPSTPTSGPSSSATRTAFFLVLKTLWYVDDDGRRRDRRDHHVRRRRLRRDRPARRGRGAARGRGCSSRSEHEVLDARPVRGGVRRLRPGRRRLRGGRGRSSRRTSTRSRRRSSPPSAPTTRPGSTCSSARSPSSAGPCCRCASRWTVRRGRRARRPPTTPRRSSATSPTTSPRVAETSTASTRCCPRPSTPTWPGSRCSRTTTCARSRPGSAWSPRRPLIAGIYGMNFDHMPELHWTLGYPFALLLMAAGQSRAALCGVFFKRSGWL